jgi:hypothetical protein
MSFASFTSFSRFCSRFLVVGCLLAVAVPTAVTVTMDTAQAASSGGGRGGGGGGGGVGGGGGGGSSGEARECLGGNCLVLTDCSDGQCGPPPCRGSECAPTPPCTGDSCWEIPGNPQKVTYVKTPIGCQVKTCEIQGNKMLCYSHKAKDENLCKKI